MHNITHIWGHACLMKFVVVRVNFAFKYNIKTKGFDWNIWLVLASLEQLHMPE